MTIQESMQETINQQINAELYSSYMYLAMAAYFDEANFPGFAHWMRKQAREEAEHAMRFYRYLVERGGRVSLAAIDKPPAEWESPLAAFEQAYEHEQKVTAMINKIFSQARSEHDPATEVMVHWFIDEQVEEEDAALGIVEQLRMIAGAKQGLLMLDHALGKRE